MNLGEAIVKIGADNEELKAKLKDSTQRLERLEKSFGKTTKGVNGMSGALGGLKSAIIGAFTVGAAVSFGKQVIEVTAQFQRLEAVLTNTLGNNSAAQQSLAMIKDFAAKTPFSVLELTDSFVKLANQGFKPTADEMKKLGDLASSTGKGFDQLTEAIIDAQTGEFERLKEFGIRAEKQGDKVTFAFKGVKTQTDFTADSIREYVLSLGDAEGVSGAMAAISETLGGKISNLGDSWDSMLNTIGEGNSGILNDTINLFKGLIDEINETEQATQKAARLGFGRKLFSEVDGLGAKMLVFQDTLMKSVNAMVTQETSSDTLRNKLLALKKQYDSLDKTTDEGRAKAIIYSDAMVVVSDRIKELISTKEKDIEASKRTVSVIDAEINAQKTLLDSQTNRAGAIVIQERINKLTREKEAILGNTEALKKQRELLEKQKGLDLTVSAVSSKGLTLKEIQTSLNKSEGVSLPINFALSESNGFVELKQVGYDISTEFNKAMASLENRVKRTEEVMKASANAINSAFTNIAIEGLATFGAALGTAFAGGDVMEIGMQFASMIADAIGGLGKNLIEIGIVMTGIMDVLSSGGFANPALLIGGGIALVALSSAMKGMMSSPVAFANGGLAFGATMGLVGEGIGTSRSNPEVIAPLDKLAGFMNPSGGMSGGDVRFRIEGNTLVGILDRQNKASKYSR